MMKAGIQTTEKIPSLPSGWRLVRLDRVCEIIAGQSPPGDTYRNSPVGLPFFQGKADFGLRHPIARVWCTAPTKIAKPGDILISVRAPVGPTNVADAECCIGRGLAAIRPGNDASGDFVLAALRYKERELVCLANGSTFTAITREHLASFQLPLPPLPEQKRIVAKLSEQMAAIEKARAAAEAQLAAAKALPAAFLREIFPKPGSKLPSGWRWMSLENICDDQIGKKDPRLTPLHPFFYVDISSIDNENKCVADAKTFLGNKAPSRARQVIRENDVVVSTTRPNLNAVAIVSKRLDGEICSTGFCVLRPTPSVHPKLLFAYVQSPYFVQTLSELVRGALYPAVTDKHVRAQLIPLPPLSDQKHIVDKINEKLMIAKRVLITIEEVNGEIGQIPAALLRKAFMRNK